MANNSNFTPQTPIRWGKYKGTPLEQIESGFLKWCVKKFDERGDWVTMFADWEDVIRQTLAERGEGPAVPSKATNGMGSARLLFAAEIRCLAKAWFGTMSKRYHPDTGGKDGQQEVVIVCYKSFMQELEKWEVSRAGENSQ